MAVIASDNVIARNEVRQLAESNLISEKRFCLYFTFSEMFPHAAKFRKAKRSAKTGHACERFLIIFKPVRGERFSLSHRLPSRARTGYACVIASESNPNRRTLTLSLRAKPTGGAWQSQIHNSKSAIHNSSLVIARNEVRQLAESNLFFFRKERGERLSPSHHPSSRAKTGCACVIASELNPNNSKCRRSF